MTDYDMNYLIRTITKYIEEKTINDYLKEVVKNNRYCSNCYFNHSGTCFFAYECIKHNFIFYDEKN